MNDLFSFHGTWVIVEQNWIWMIVALGLGIWVGWKTCAPARGQTS